MKGKMLLYRVKAFQTIILRNVLKYVLKHQKVEVPQLEKTKVWKEDGWLWLEESFGMERRRTVTVRKILLDGKKPDDC